MGREIHRVPLDFDWPMDKMWTGYEFPPMLAGVDCPACENGFSAEYERLHRRWYGYDNRFVPTDTGSEWLTPSTPEVRAFAERNVAHSPEYYGRGEAAIVTEGQRLANLWNVMWCHHLRQVDVDALVAAGRLMDFTHTWSRNTGWVKRDPMPAITAAAVNRWSLGGMAHDSINAWVVVRAECERNGWPVVCSLCDGEGTLQRFEGQRTLAEKWERHDPPTGDGWQLWQTVSEGAPISPVFEDAEGLAQWMASPAYTWGASGPLDIEVARKFVGVGWAPSLVATPATGLIPGEQWGGSSDGS